MAVLTLRVGSLLIQAAEVFIPMSCWTVCPLFDVHFIGIYAVLVTGNGYAQHNIDTGLISQPLSQTFKRIYRGYAAYIIMNGESERMRMEVVVAYFIPL